MKSHLLDQVFLTAIKSMLANVLQYRKKNKKQNSYLLRHKQSTTQATQFLLEISFWRLFRAHLVLTVLTTVSSSPLLKTVKSAGNHLLQKEVQTQLGN